MPVSSFSELPLISTDDEVREIHRGNGVFFVKRGGKAHSSMTCIHLDDTQLANNPAWRRATDIECRALGIGWCEDC